MPFAEGALYRDNDFEAPSGAAEFSPRREPWVLSSPLSPSPLPRGAGEGEQKGEAAVLPRALALGYYLPPLRGYCDLHHQPLGRPAGGAYVATFFVAMYAPLEEYNPGMPGPQRYYGLNHLHYLTNSTHRRASVG